MGGNTLRYDYFLIADDIHVCCESRSLVKVFLYWFRHLTLFSQSWFICRHHWNLQLMFIRSFSVLFTVHCSVVPARLASVFNSCMSIVCFFSIISWMMMVNSVWRSSLISLTGTVEKYWTLLLLQEGNAIKHFMNDGWTTTLRWTLRQTGRKWKRNKLQVSFGIPQGTPVKYQIAVKRAKTEFLSKLKANNSHKTQVLLNVFNFPINHRVSDCLAPSNMLCGLRMSSSGIFTTPLSLLCTQLFSSSLRQLLSPTYQTALSWKPQLGWYPCISFKDVFDRVGSGVLSSVNTSPRSGVIPAAFKSAVV